MKTDDSTGEQAARKQDALTHTVGARLEPRATRKRWFRLFRRAPKAAAQ